MLPESRTYLHDAVSAAESIQTFIGENDYDEYVANRLLHSAVERQFEIIGEALTRISRHDSTLAAQIPSLRDIVDFRNVIAHGYDVIDHEIIWDIIQNHLQPLIESCRKFLLT